jgi:hypothetical protein
LIRRGWHILLALAAIGVAMPAESAVAAPRDAGAPPPGPRAAPALPSSGAQSEPIDLNEGKSPAEMFASGCAVCHQRPQGLARGRDARALTGFLRQHYTTGIQQAGTIAGFLTSGGLERGTPTPVRASPATTDESDRPGARRPPARPADIAAPEGASAQNRNRRPAAPAAEQGPDGVIYLPPGATDVPDDAGRRRETRPPEPAAPPAAARPPRQAPRPTETARPAEPARPAPAEADSTPPPATSAASPPAEEKPAPPPRDNIPL